MHRHQRRGTLGVDGQRGPFQAERVGDAAGDHAGGVAGEQLSLGFGGRRMPGGAIVLQRHPGEDAGPAAPQRPWVEARVLQNLPGDLQHQPLLRVHGLRLAWTDTEESRVEQRDAGQEPAMAGVGGARLIGIRIVERVEVPAPVVGQAADGIPALSYQVPQGFW